ncbi:MAG: solute carrier family 23 protein [Usitatibacteraceae bacterium]
MSFFPILRWLPELRRPGAIRADVLAGLTGAIVVLPQGVAFATLAGMPPQYGLYSAMVPCLIAAIFGSSRLMVTGPANAISLMTMSLIVHLAVPGTPQYVSLVLTLTFMVGLMQLLLGLVRAGRFVDIVPHSVVVGFTTGAAILIINSQLAPAMGIEGTRGLSIAANLKSLWSQASAFSLTSIVTCTATILACILWRPWNKKVPALLVGVIAGSLIGHLAMSMSIFAIPLKMVSPIPSGWPPFSSPDLSAATLTSLALPAFTMTLIALTEAMAIARAVAMKYRDKLDGNQEMIGQGLANLAGAFFSSYPSSGSFNRSGVNVQSGARTPLAAVCAALLLVAILLVVSPYVTLLPLCVVSALLFVVAFGLIDVAEMQRIWITEPEQRIPLLLTAIATVTLSLEWAILLGIASAFAAKSLFKPKV